MGKSLSTEIIQYLDNYNKDFEKKHGYFLCRCYSCFLPILLDIYKKLEPDESPEDKISKAIQAINDDYLYSADFKMDIRSKSGLICGYDCKHYEDVPEAAPLSFWEIDKSNLQALLELLDKLNDTNMINSK